LPLARKTVVASVDKSYKVVFVTGGNAAAVRWPAYVDVLSFLKKKKSLSV
jgi:putative intracellular protease/amidase